MRAEAAGTVGDAPLGGVADPETRDRDSFRGRIVVHPRVLQKVAREAAASTLGVDRGSLSVDALEGSRGVSIRIASPLPVPDLDDTAAIQAGDPVLARVARIQEELRERIAPMIGRDVTRVDITITGALIAQKRRVK